MADEVPDYMSAEFVTEKKMTKEEQRRAKLKRKRTPKDQIKPAKEIQRERLEEGTVRLLATILMTFMKRLAVCCVVNRFFFFFLRASQTKKISVFCVLVAEPKTSLPLSSKSLSRLSVSPVFLNRFFLVSKTVFRCHSALL